VNQVRTRIWAGVLALCAFGSYAVLTWLTPEEADLADARLADRDNAVLGVEMRVYDAKGQPNLRLVSPRIQSPRGTELYEVESPRFEVLSPSAGRWHGQAQRGALDTAASRLQLESSVMLDGVRAEQAPVKIRGERLDFDLETRIVTSELPVEVTQNRNRLRGVGLEANLRTDQYRLLSQVEGRYVPVQP
jgi:lipopolysaccharide export system protein LptC